MGICIQFVEDTSFWSGVLDFIKDPASWFSIIAALCAVYGIYQTKTQIALSNKHQLFDKRISNYMAVKDLIQGYRLNQSSLMRDRGTNPPAPKEQYRDLSHLCSCRLLENISLNSTPIKPVSNVLEFRTAAEKLQTLQGELIFLFPEDVAVLLASFIEAYVNALSKWYLYTTRGWRPSYAVTDEPSMRNELYDAYARLDKSYTALMENKVEARLIEIIQLQEKHPRMPWRHHDKT